MFRLTVGTVIVCKGHILIGRSHAGYWGMPQGGIEKGESAAEAATRELAEETGLLVNEWQAETDWHTLILADFVRKNNNRYKNFIGQKYKWFLAKLNAFPLVTICPHEYTGYEWALPGEILDRASLKRDMYMQVFAEFHVLD